MTPTRKKRRDLQREGGPFPRSTPEVDQGITPERGNLATRVKNYKPRNHNRERSIPTKNPLRKCHSLSNGKGIPPLRREGVIHLWEPIKDYKGIKKKRKKTAKARKKQNFGPVCLQALKTDPYSVCREKQRGDFLSCSGGEPFPER